MVKHMRLFSPGQRFFVIDFETTGVDVEKCYPIEVGVIVTDECFNAIESYQSLILPHGGPAISWRILPHGGPAISWTGEELRAFKVHGIHPDDFSRAQSPSVVAQEFVALARRHAGGQGQKPVLVSDNIQFEWALTRQLIQHFDWPFHYCGWDSSLLLEAAGVGDPKPAHRALADAGLLHAAIVRALDRIRSLNS